MKKPKPLNKEIRFNFQELFFSTTDAKGNIQFGNDVFIRISGYQKENIIGAPHNIIRHPDMPRCVFKLFWETLKLNQPIGAYVKNLSADGSYYWVFAFAFPVKDGYLSIRFRPSSSLFEKVQEVYKEVLAKEAETSIDESEAYLLDLIRSSGFPQYEDFMVHAAIEELSCREKNISLDMLHQSSGDSTTQEISEVTKKTALVLDQNFAKISIFQEGSKVYSESVALLQEEFNQLKFLSLNMKVLAAKFGDQAATLGVISQEFSNLATKIESQLHSFSVFTEELSQVVKRCSLHLAALKSQMIMVDFFVKESIENMKTSDHAFAGMLDNRDLFTTLFSSSINQLNSEIDLLKKRLLLVTSQIKEVQKFTSGLEVIKQTGAIESARDEEIKSSFDFYLKEMDNFIVLLRKTITTLNYQREDLTKNADEIRNSTCGPTENINTLFSLALVKR